MQDHGGFEETIPKLFRQTWQLEGSLQHLVRPHSQASNTCQEEGTNRVKGGNRQGAGLSLGTASFLGNAFWSQNEPRRVSASDGCHSRAVPRSDRNP